MDCILRRADEYPTETGRPEERASNRDRTAARSIAEFADQENHEALALISDGSSLARERTDTVLYEFPPLYETIDTDAFEAFLRRSDSPDTHPTRAVAFAYCGFRIVADSNEQVERVTDAEPSRSIPVLRS